MSAQTLVEKAHVPPDTDDEFNPASRLRLEDVLPPEIFYGRSQRPPVEFVVSTQAHRSLLQVDPRIYGDKHPTVNVEVRDVGFEDHLLLRSTEYVRELVGFDPDEVLLDEKVGSGLPRPLRTLY